jgi:hypothetical protein
MQDIFFRAGDDIRWIAKRAGRDLDDRLDEAASDKRRLELEMDEIEHNMHKRRQNGWD